MRKSHFLAIFGLLLIIAGIVLWSQPTALAQDDDAGDGVAGGFLQAYFDEWSGSGHADAEAEAFVHWNEDGEVSESCATCHSTPGYRDFLGEDGSAAGVVDAPAPLGTTVNCDACHSSAAASLTSVTFPSGAEITNLSEATRCMVCHQGRSSGITVDNAIAEAGLTEDLDAVSPDLSFINIHYYAAAASLYGAEAHGGYQFADQNYQIRFEHVEGYNTCTSCHSPHTLEVQIAECTNCHEDVESVEDLRDIRMNGSLADYDGDGDVDEGIAGEIETLQELLYQNILTYANEVVGEPIVYESHSHPYFFYDTNGNGEPDDDEVNGDNRYSSFTPRLLQAAYNYQVSQKDPGNFAHNAKYHIQLLYDSIDALNQGISEPVDLSTASRVDPGHFDATGEPFRHWDADGEVPGTCTKCHTSEGLPFFLEQGTTISFEPSNSLACSTCHNDISEFTLYEVNEVTFPSGAVVSFGEGQESNLCINCHQGRESTVSVNRAIASAGVGSDEVSEALSFRNPHYFAAGATLFGTEAQGGYEYEGQEYNGVNEHTRRFDTCTDCHDTHALEIRASLCVDCHEQLEESEDLRVIRAHEDDKDPVDYDGDGDDEEPVYDEIMTLHDDLLVRIREYAATNLGTPVTYDAHAYPYWYADPNENGVVDEGEERYSMWTPALLRAAYNYQYVAKDPGAFAHNPDYVLQLLYDSLREIGGADAVTSYTRPAVRESDDDDD